MATPTATRPFHNRLVVAFDFDETLAHSTYETVLTSLGIDPEKFSAGRFQRRWRVDGVPEACRRKHLQADFTAQAQRG